MNQPIRVLHVLQRMEAGGTQALLMNIYRNIDRNKVQFDFLVEYPNKQFYDSEIISLGGRVYYTNVRKDKNIFKFQKVLKNIIDENKYKIIHVHTYSIGYFVLKTAKKCGVPVRIAHSHNNETVHDSKYFLKLFMQKLYTIYATDFIACSKEAGDYLFGKEDYWVLPNAIDSRKFVSHLENTEKKIDKLIFKEKFVVGHVGRLHPQKNHKFLLDIFKEIKKIKTNAVLVLVGTGPMEEEIRERVNKLGLSDSVYFLGNRKDMPSVYQAFDVFLLPSLFEGLGIVAVESQASGIPTICSEGVPDEANVSPLYKKCSLNDNASTWARTVIDFSENPYAHTNVQDYIKKSGFDISSTTGLVQNFYVNNFEKNK